MAFKEDRTGELKALALKKGFRGVDSANYPSAYEEPSVGIAMVKRLGWYNFVLFITKIFNYLLACRLYFLYFFTLSFRLPFINARIWAMFKLCSKNHGTLDFH